MTPDMKMRVVNTLTDLKDAARRRKYAHARDILEELAGMVNPQEWQHLKLALDSIDIGETTVLLDRVCNHLIQKYRQDIDPRTFTRTVL